MADYWLYSWIDENEIRSVSDATKRIAEPGALTNALVLAEASDQAREEIPAVRNEYPIVAGAQMDLSASVSCASPVCQIHQVERLFSTVWHYFDVIIVEGLAPQFLPHPDESLSPKVATSISDAILRHVTVALHLRQVGADKYLEFRTKPHAFCAEHFQQHAGELGIPALLDDSVREEVMSRILQGAVLEEHAKDAFAFNSPALELTRLFMPGDSDGSEPMSRPNLEDAAEEAYMSLAVAAVGDVALARDLNSALALTIDDVLLNPGRPQDQVSESTVALELDLPFLRDLSTSELINIKEEYRSEFDTFRHAVTQAIREAIEATGDADASAIATRVRREYITPALADIETRLSAAQRLLRRKLSLDTSVAAVSTAVGLMTGVPLVVGAGLAAGARGFISASRYMEDRREIELSDMYFMWRASAAHRSTERHV